MVRIGSLEIGISAGTARLQKDMAKAVNIMESSAGKMALALKKLEGHFNGVKLGIMGIQGAMVAFAGSAAIGQIKNLTAQFQETERQVSTLRDALLETGRSASVFKELEANAESLARQTTASASALMEATGRIALLNKHLRPDELEDTQRVVIALADSLHINLSQAAFMVEKTLAGNINQLGRYGISIDMTKDAHHRLQEMMRRTNDMFEMSKNLSQTLEGRTIQLHNAWGGLQSTLGDLIIKMLGGAEGIKKLTDRIMELDKWIKTNERTILEWGNGFGIVIMNCLKLGSGLVLGMSGVVSGIASLIVGMVDDAMAGINNIIRGTIQNINGMIGFVNQIPLVNIPAIKVPFQLDHSGVANTRRVLQDVTKDIFKTAQLSYASISGLNSNYQVPTVTRATSGGGLLDDEHGADKKKKGAHKKTEAEKELERMKHAAEKLRESLLSVWEKYKHDVAEAQTLHKAGLITFQEMSQATTNMGAEFDKNIGFDKQAEDLQKFLEESQELVLVLPTMFDVVDQSGEAFGKLNENIQWAEEIMTKAKEKGVDPLTAGLERLKTLKDVLSEEDYQKVAAAINTLNRHTIDFSQALGQAASQFGDKFFNTFTESLKTGQFAFKEFAASIMEDLGRLMFRLSITIPLAEHLANALKGNSGGGGFLAGLLKFGKSATAAVGPLPGFADGGRTPAGKPFIVGERGPELMQFGRSGYVTPNHALGGGMTSISIVNHITVEGSNGNGNEQGNKIAEVITRQVRAAITEELRVQKRPGGMLSQGAY